MSGPLIPFPSKIHFMNNTLEPGLMRAFRFALRLPENTDYKGLEFAKSAGWDSIAHLLLISSIEREFDIMISTTDVLAMSSFPKAVDIVKKYVQH